MQDKHIAIMQPYFLPYIGYWQLINMVDVFVVYDNIQFSKKGWVQRNRILQNGSDSMVSLTLKKDSDYLNINQRNLSENFFLTDRDKLLNRIKNNYQKAPMFNKVFPLVEEILFYEENNLFYFVLNSIQTIKEYLDINTPLINSSKLNVQTEKYKGQEKVIQICKNIKAKQYVNPIGGRVLYDAKSFNNHKIELKFLQTCPKIEYPQFSNKFVSNLSIVDVLMFNEKDRVKNLLNNYSLV